MKPPPPPPSEKFLKFDQYLMPIAVNSRKSSEFENGAYGTNIYSHNLCIQTYITG